MFDECNGLGMSTQSRRSMLCLLAKKLQMGNIANGQSFLFLCIGAMGRQ